jgi:PAS domain S-box-containing protein
MQIKWLFKFSKRKATNTDLGLYQNLFQFLRNQITVPRNAEQLIQLSHKSGFNNNEEAFHTYLLFEKYICTFEPEQKFTPQLLRHEIARSFPDLKNKDPFPILFLTDTEKKNTLAIEFLQAFLSGSLEQFGQTGDNYLNRKQNELEALKSRIGMVLLFNELQFISFDIFHFISKNYGVSLAGKIFERNYERFSSKYKELETFPHIITLIPKEIVKREHLGLFTQAQIEQVFLEKLAETERLNDALNQKIKELEVTQQLLSKNEAMLGSVISSALDAIIIFNREGQLIQWNEAASDIFGYTPDEVRGINLIPVILSGEYLQLKDFSIQQLLEDPANRFMNRRFEIRCKRKNEEVFPAELTVTSFHNNNDHYFNAFIRDISVRKQKQEELVRTKEKAEQAAKAKSQFLSIMSHEIRTPLNAIIGFSELLNKNNPREDQKEDLRMLSFSGEHLLNIINDILDFNKLESGKVQLSYVSFNLRELAQSLYQSFSYKAKEKKIVFDVEYDERMPFIVKGDSLRISQILNNLISNAIKFTDKGSVKLKIMLNEISEKGLETIFSVIDTGIGIAEDKHHKIFEQFIQADSDTTRLYGGTGLGLSISKKLVELMGSDMVVESKPGKGSAFRFNIMLQPSDEIQPQAVGDRKKKEDSNSFKNKRILLAEDNTFNANIARRYINGWGADMDLALDGQQALEFALRNKYDLILMDVQMPVLD